MRRGQLQECFSGIFSSFCVTSGSFRSLSSLVGCSAMLSNFLPISASLRRISYNFHERSDLFLKIAGQRLGTRGVRCDSQRLTGSFCRQRSK